MLYRALRPLLFALDPERAHGLSLKSLDVLARLGIASLAATSAPRVPVRVMGLDFPNPVGLAAGLDKDGRHIDGLGALGFGFLEIGAVTPRAQPGNARPRLFRLPEADALINRLGFNNDGVDALTENIRRSSYRGVLGVNVGKNSDTPNERAADDYIACLRKVYPFASFVTANVSSPNTKDLRALQHASRLDALLAALAAERDSLSKQYGKRLPLAVKVAPDLDEPGIEAIADRVAARDAVDGSDRRPPANRLLRDADRILVQPRWIDALPRGRIHVRSPGGGSAPVVRTAAADDADAHAHE